MTLNLTGGSLFIISLTKCFDIDPETDASITVYCDNLSALIQVEKPLRKRSTRHHMIPEYNLVKKLQQWIEKLHLDINPEHIKCHQGDGSPVYALPWPARINIAGKKIIRQLSEQHW